MYNIVEYTVVVTDVAANDVAVYDAVVSDVVVHDVFIPFDVERHVLCVYHNRTNIAANYLTAIGTTHTIKRYN